MVKFFVVSFLTITFLIYKYKKEVWIGSLLIDEVVESEDLVEKIIIEASQYPANDSNNCNGDDIHHVVPHSNIAYIKYDQSSFPKCPHFPELQISMKALSTTTTTAVLKKVLQRRELLHHVAPLPEQTELHLQGP